MKNRILSTNSRKSGDEIDLRVKVIHAVNLLFTDAFNYRTFCWLNREKKYYDKNAECIWNMGMRLQVQMINQVFGASDSVSLPSFRKTFERARESNKILEGATTWLVHYVLKTTSIVALFSRLEPMRSWPSKRNKKDGSLFAYTKAVNHLLTLYITSNVIAKAISNISLFI